MMNNKYIIRSMLLVIGCMIGYLGADYVEVWEETTPEIQESPSVVDSQSPTPAPGNNGIPDSDIQPETDEDNNKDTNQQQHSSSWEQDRSSSRSWNIESNAYTITPDNEVSTSEQRSKPWREVYHITRQGYEGKILLIQTTDEPDIFLNKYFSSLEWFEGNMGQSLRELQAQGDMQRSLHDGALETQFWITSQNDPYLYAIDLRAARGCQEQSTCLYAAEVLQKIGWR